MKLVSASGPPTARSVLGARARRVLSILALTLAAFALTLGVARAASLVFYEGNVGSDGQYGPKHSLTEVSARLLNSGAGGNACVNAWNPYPGPDGFRFVGSNSCTGATNGVTSHPYCGCALRQGWVGSSTGYQSLVRGREDY